MIVAYQGDDPKQVILSREVWNEAKKDLDEIDAAAASLQRAMAEIDMARQQPARSNGKELLLADP